MDQKEWKSSQKYEGKYIWYNKAKQIQRSLVYNKDAAAKVIHHLRDTEDQRKYNDEHYEFWGFNQDGSFEYGKYVVFVTNKEHTEIHKHSEETRRKMREHNAKSMLGKHHSEDAKHSISSALKGITRSDDTKNKISLANKGKIVSQETRDKLSKSISKIMTPEHKAFISERTKESMTDEVRIKCSKSQKERFANMTDEELSKFKAKCKEVSNRDSVKLANSIAHKELWQDEEYRQKQIASHTGKIVTEETKEKHRQRTLSLWQDEEYRNKVSTALKLKDHTKEHDDKVRLARKQMSDAYKLYKTNGGILKWNDFQKVYKEDDKLSLDGVVGALYNAKTSKEAVYNPSDILNLSRFNSGDLDNYAEALFDDPDYINPNIKRVSLVDLEDPFRYLNTDY